MMEIRFPNISAGGDAASQVVQMRSFLYQLVQDAEPLPAGAGGERWRGGAGQAGGGRGRPAGPGGAGPAGG